mgnify:CR=1 FL=1|jgi:2-ketocyclohexanecarboxyl-CoA hydrolase
MSNTREFEDILYEVKGRAAWITINRPELYNAFRATTIEEMITAFKLAADDKEVSCVVLTGAGDKAFCTGGDQSAKDGQYDGRGIVGLPIDELQSIIRDIPKPVIARINGFAIGGGNVFATLCDMSIMSESAKLGQVGPKVGSVDAGWGTALLARHVGDKKAREIWYLNLQYTAQEALEMGLVNRIVPHEELDTAVTEWTDIIAQRSPTAIALAKRSFNADSDNIRGITMLALNSVKLYYDTEESKEGMRAFKEKRTPEFHKYLK